jgi:spore maturation protein CgeB
MTENAECLDRFYRDGKEIVVYEGISDLMDKITYFLSHMEERDRIAMAGHLRTREEHTYELRFQNLLKIASQLRKARGAGQCAVDLAKFW